MNSISKCAFRLLTINGETENCIKTILAILPTLEEAQKFGNAISGHELRLLLHQSQAGCIIGKAGDKIKDLRTVSLCSSDFIESNFIFF